MSIDIYTDGSFKKNGKKVYCGYGIHFPNKEYKDIGRKFTHNPITNNRAELYAILKTLTICNMINEKTKINNINIYSDSEYSVKTINVWYKGWLKSKKKYLNPDIIDEIILLIEKSPFKTKIIHVSAHVGIEGNEKADFLAKKGAQR
jgi:ribonuclease HI